MKNLKVFALVSALAVAACADNNPGSVSYSLSTRKAPAPAPSAAVSAAGGPIGPSVVAAPDSIKIALGTDTVIIRSAMLVLREVELKRVEATTCDDIVGNDDCEEFETGPVLVELPLGFADNNANTASEVTVSAPAGLYDELEFEVHKPDAVEDANFIAQVLIPAGFPSDQSIRVSGTFASGNTRTDFVYTSDLNEKQEHLLSPPLDVMEGVARNVTLRLDLSLWFMNATRTALVDPASANKGNPNENLVRDNIRASIDAFHDDDHDGLDDDHEGS